MRAYSVRKILLTILLFLTATTSSYAEWRMNQYTGKQDYYEYGVNSTPANNTFKKLDNSNSFSADQSWGVNISTGSVSINDTTGVPFKIISPSGWDLNISTYAIAGYYQIPTVNISGIQALGFNRGIVLHDGTPSNYSVIAQSKSDGDLGALATAGDIIWLNSHNLSITVPEGYSIRNAFGTPEGYIKYTQSAIGETAILFDAVNNNGTQAFPYFKPGIGLYGNNTTYPALAFYNSDAAITNALSQAFSNGIPVLSWTGGATFTAGTQGSGIHDILQLNSCFLSTSLPGDGGQSNYTSRRSGSAFGIPFQTGFTRAVATNTTNGTQSSRLELGATGSGNDTSTVHLSLNGDMSSTFYTSPVGNMTVDDYHENIYGLVDVNIPFWKGTAYSSNTGIIPLSGYATGISDMAVIRDESNDGAVTLAFIANSFLGGSDNINWNVSLNEFTVGGNWTCNAADTWLGNARNPWDNTYFRNSTISENLFPAANNTINVGTITNFVNNSFLTTIYGRNISLGQTSAPVTYIDIRTGAGLTRAMRIGPQSTVVDSGSYIEFSSSGTDGYGAQVGGIRDGASGAGAFIIRTGGNSQVERFRISNNGDLSTTQNVTIGDVLYGNTINNQSSYMLGSDMQSFFGSTMSLCFIPRNVGNGTNETDLSYQNNTALYNVSSSWTTSDRLFQGRVFAVDPDGTDDFLWIADSDTLSFGDGSTDQNFTIIASAQITATTGNQDLISKWSDATLNQREWLLRVNTLEQADLFVRDESAAVQAHINCSVMSAGWHTVMVTYDNSLGTGATFLDGVKIYVDGVNQSTTKAAQATYVAMENDISPVILGGINSTGSVIGNFYKGDYGMILIAKNRTISENEAKYLHTRIRGYYNL